MIFVTPIKKIERKMLESIRKIEKKCMRVNQVISKATTIWWFFRIQTYDRHFNRAIA